MVDERSAAGRRDRAASPGCAATSPFWCLSGATCHSSLRPIPYFCGSTPSRRLKRLHQLLRQRAAAAFGEQRVLRVELHAGLVFALVRAVPRHAHVAGRDAAHRALVVVQDLGGGEAGVDLDAERFRLLAEPAADVAEARDVHAVVVHQPRQRPVRNAVRLFRRQDQEAVLGDRRVERRALRLPVGQELVQRARIDDRARKDVRADLRALFEQADGDFAAGLRGELLQADRRGEPRGAAADDHDVVFHGFALHDGPRGPRRGVQSDAATV